MNHFKQEKLLVNVPAKKSDAIPLAITFPNTYQVGMASLGYQTAWKILNESQDVNTFRWFKDTKEENVAPEYIGFSLSWELDFINIFDMLKKENIPIHAENRTEEDPLIFAGGLVPNANPEPFCKNFDFFLLGDLEIVGRSLIEALPKIKDLSRREKLEKLSEIEGIYTPHVGQQVSDKVQGVSDIKQIKKPISKKELSWSPIITPDSYWADTFIVEVVRSCPELCRFCLASYGSLPFRTPDAKESLIPTIDFGLEHANKIGILGASVTQHPEFETLINHLIQINEKREASDKLHVQIASVRADTITQSLAEGLHKLGIKSVTMAIESGSERLRKIINKKVSNETIFDSIKTLYDAGITKIKLYGMVGLPQETEDDLKDTIDLLKEIKTKNKGKILTWGCSVFVPKAGTPFQYFGIDKGADKKLKLFQKELGKAGIDFRPESYKWSLIQGLISRGDRSINSILEKAYENSGTLGAFKKAIKEYDSRQWTTDNGYSKNSDQVSDAQCPMSNYFIHENWSFEDKLPWSHLQGHLQKSIIDDHAKEAIQNS